LELTRKNIECAVTRAKQNMRSQGEERWEKEGKRIAS